MLKKVTNVCARHVLVDPTSCQCRKCTSAKLASMVTNQSFDEARKLVDVMFDDDGNINT